MIDPFAVETTVHRDPAPEGYRSIVKAAAGDLLTPQAVPTLAVRLSDLDIA